eukprot:TRINITY_DN1275_c0_g1_i4.p2 TRINITY_DN1275_c0_g1~~TRINITY_DN1275_c0_g1_i4.p2  ORF type:complete len:110 (+),score=15.50 TRINITY_DN1275_c0_g1_i4:813-1142(+)
MRSENIAHDTLTFIQSSINPMNPRPPNIGMNNIDPKKITMNHPFASLFSPSIKYDSILDFTFKPGKLQSESRKPSPSPMMTRYLKVIINSGWDDFVTIHKVYVEGSLPA